MSTLAENPQLDDALILRMAYDLALGMHNPGVIARRYGLADEIELRGYLREHPQLVFEARRLRAMFNSDEATEQRIRTKFLRATEQLIIPMTALVADPRTPIAQRIDGFKQIQRGAGVDGAPAAAAKDQKNQGAPFNLTINFAAGGRQQHIAATTVVDADEIRPPVMAPMLRLSADEDEYEEEDV